MGLAFYQFHIFTNDFKQELNGILTTDLNLGNPQVIDLRKLSNDEQRIATVMVEDYFSTHNLSLHFPYPIYVLSELTEKFNVTTLKRESDLPRFFSKRPGKMNVKETHLSDKNALLQREIKNSDNLNNTINLKNFSYYHHRIFIGERERYFYELILKRLNKR
jgi:hypothetical protein